MATGLRRRCRAAKSRDLSTEIISSSFAVAKFAELDRATVAPASAVDVVALLARIDALERRVVQLESRHRMRDDVRAAALVALAASVQYRTFTAVSAIEHAQQADPELLSALHTAGVATPRTLGRWLRTLQGKPIAGLRVERLDKDRDGALWMFRGGNQSTSGDHDRA